MTVVATDVTQALVCVFMVPDRVCVCHELKEFKKGQSTLTGSSSRRKRRTGSKRAAEGGSTCQDPADLGHASQHRDGKTHETQHVTRPQRVFLRLSLWPQQEQEADTVD